MFPKFKSGDKVVKLSYAGIVDWTITAVKTKDPYAVPAEFVYDIEYVDPFTRMFHSDVTETDLIPTYTKVAIPPPAHITPYTPPILNTVAAHKSSRHLFATGEEVEEISTGNLFTVEFAADFNYIGEPIYDIVSKKTGNRYMQFEENKLKRTPKVKITPIAIDCKIVKSSALGKDFFYCRTHDAESNGMLFCGKAR